MKIKSIRRKVKKFNNKSCKRLKCKGRCTYKSKKKIKCSKKCNCKMINNVCMCLKKMKKSYKKNKSKKNKSKKNKSKKNKSKRFLNNIKMYNPFKNIKLFGGG